jgi:16S rRNA C967 or C1407 C5-methylase (RsmB/RsmF family)/NOL1/NOP2/fmu family ribosome biogenesis protein
MFPAKFIERLRQQEYIDAYQLEEALDKPSPVSIRINPGKWKRTPANSARVSWSDFGYYLDSRPSFTFDPLFHSGCYYPQEASGMFLEQAYNQLVNHDKIKVLDLCGAPGGKSTHLASLIGDKGFLVANEVIRTRAGILAENIIKCGIGNTIVTNYDPVAFSRLNNYFDLILIDAPCSGEGMFSDPNIRREWSPENAALCSERQRRIVMDVWPSLKENGILIYSTCTFNPAENEENIEWLSERTGATSIKLDISEFDGIQEIRYKGITGYGFHPGKIKGEGLFLSIVKKSRLSSDPNKRQIIRNNNQLTNSDLKIAAKLINTSLTNLYRHDEIVYHLSLPVEEYQYLNNYLRIIKGGTALFKTRKDDFSPIHDLALYCKIKEDAFPIVDLAYSKSISFLKKENIEFKDASKGWILLKYSGINLGFVKNIGSRVNNYFPTEWRIRMNAPADIHQMLIDWNPPDPIKKVVELLR